MLFHLFYYARWKGSLVERRRAHPIDRFWPRDGACQSGGKERRGSKYDASNHDTMYCIFERSMRWSWTSVQIYLLSVLGRNKPRGNRLDHEFDLYRMSRQERASCGTDSNQEFIIVPSCFLKEATRIPRRYKRRREKLSHQRVVGAY